MGVRACAFHPGPPSLWEEAWARASHTAAGEEDVSAWPYSVSILVKSLPFLSSLVFAFRR